MKELTNMRNAIAEEMNSRIAEAEKAIAESDEALENYSTTTRWEQYKRNAITRQQAEGYAANRMKKAAVKTYSAKLARIVEAEKTEVKRANLSILIEWKPSRTWGYNPTAHVTLTAETADGTHKYQTATGTAGGCGYDKGSAAVAQALNMLPIMDAELIRAKETRLAHDEGMPYGSGYGVMPYVKGGTGLSCIADILKACGYRCISSQAAGTCEAYSYEKRENSAQEN